MAKESSQLLRTSRGPLPALVSAIFLGILVFWLSTLKLGGLHGDESWFGLTAAAYLRNGITRPFGMNSYTGILQSASAAVVFKLFGIGVPQLRITGVIFNTLALLGLLQLLGSTKGIKSSLCFLLLFTQSTVYMLYPKVAWEVCSFTLFFACLFALSLLRISDSDGKHQAAWASVLLGSSFLGMHNHILFSSLPLAALTGLVVWKLYNRNAVDGIRSIAFLSLNMANLIVHYFFVMYEIESLWDGVGLFCFAPLFILLALELVYREKIISQIAEVLRFAFKLKLPRGLLLAGLLISVAIFAYHHGIAVWQIFCQNVIYLRIFSYEPPPYLEWPLVAIGATLLLFLGYIVVTDIAKHRARPFVFVLLAYMGTFSLYTTDNSIRYYFLFIAVVFIYLAYRLVEQQRPVFAAMTFALVIGSVLVQGSIWHLSLDCDRKVHAIRFPLGNNWIETSAHFLRFEPVLEYLWHARIGRIETWEPHFIGRNFDFYKLVYPRFQQYPNTARIDYEFYTWDDGFRKSRIEWRPRVTFQTSQSR